MPPSAVINWLIHCASPPCSRRTPALPRSGPGLIAAQPRTQAAGQTLPATNINGEDKGWGTLGVLDSQQRWFGGGRYLNHLKIGPGS